MKNAVVYLHINSYAIRLVLFGETEATTAKGYSCREQKLHVLCTRDNMVHDAITCDSGGFTNGSHKILRSSEQESNEIPVDGTVGYEERRRAEGKFTRDYRALK